MSSKAHAKKFIAPIFAIVVLEGILDIRAGLGYIRLSRYSPLIRYVYI